MATVITLTAPVDPEIIQVKVSGIQDPYVIGVGPVNNLAPGEGLWIQTGPDDTEFTVRVGSGANA